MISQINTSMDELITLCLLPNIRLINLGQKQINNTDMTQVARKRKPALTLVLHTIAMIQVAFTSDTSLEIYECQRENSFDCLHSISNN